MATEILSMSAALNDWLQLLQGPANPPFLPQANFQGEWKRLFRLMTLVMIMIIAVLTFSYLGLNAAQQEDILKTFLKNTVAQTRYTIFIILLGALFAALYTLIIAPLFKVKINIPQTFFTFLFLLLPWIPIVVLVWVLGYILPDFPLLAFFIILFLNVIFPIIFVFKFSQGIALVSGCKKKRCLASIAIPFFVFAILIWLISFNKHITPESNQSSAQKVSFPVK